VVHPHADPPRVAGQIVDPVRDRFPVLRDEEIVHPHRRGLPFRPPLATGVLEVADQFLLLRVDRDDRLGRRLEPPDLLVDVPELGVAIGMGRPFAGLAIGLQTVARRRQQFRHQLPADLMPHTLQARRQLADTLRGPAQRRHRIARRRGLHQPLEIGQEGRIFVERPLATAARTSNPVGRQRAFRRQLLKPALNRGIGDSGRARHPGDAAPAGGPRLGRRPNPPCALRQRRSQGFVLRPAEADIHASSLLSRPSNPCTYSLTMPYPSGGLEGSPRHDGPFRSVGRRIMRYDGVSATTSVARIRPDDDPSSSRPLPLTHVVPQEIGNGRPADLSGSHP
jgi:hypothetical protein